MNNLINEAVNILNQGGIIIYPTDTAFGIGCRIDRIDSIRKLFKVRRRPKNQATPVLVDSTEMAEKYYSEIPKDVRLSLLEKYWPGALTVILPANIKAVPSLVRGGKINIGLRMPNHEIVQQLINGIGVPLLGPSANFHGENTPFTFDQIDKGLIKLVDLVIPGNCYIKQASTVIDCSISPWKIIRQGALRLSLN